MQYTIIATCAFGLESVVSRELKGLGYRDLSTETGRVRFEGDESDIARCNLHLRTADRVLIELARFEARDFEELFQGALAIPWGEIIPKEGKMHVTGKSVKSQLFSVPSCQSIVKKAIVESMRSKYLLDKYPETGPLYKVEVSLLKDVVSLTIDTTGAGLHKRGYRQDAGEAPLRETLAAAIVLLSGWRSDRILADPFCGSGTIPIEAALIARNIAPGISRTFTSETWPQMSPGVWRDAREEARQAVRDTSLTILASDRDGSVLRKAMANAKRAGISDCIAFQRLDVSAFRSSKKYGCIISNPPYGERTGEEKEMEELYREMGKVFDALQSWSFFILTAHPEFQRLFGRRATKNRKLYNGMIRCYLYEYFGPKPPSVQKRPLTGDQTPFNSDVQ